MRQRITKIPEAIGYTAEYHTHDAIAAVGVKCMRVLTLIATILLSLNVHAQNFTWNGVFTQAFIHTDDNNLYGKSEDNVSLDFTEFSLNGSYNLPKSTRMSAQVIYRHAGAGFDGVNLDYLFVDHQFLTTQKSIGGARLGRIKFPVGLYNNTRDIAFTRPSIYLSQAIYFDLSDRDVMLSGDGLEFYLSHFTDFGSFTSSFSYVFIDENTLSNQEQNFPRNTKLYIEDGIAYRFHYDSLDKRFRVAFSGNYTDSFGSRVNANLNQFSPFLPSSLAVLDTKILTRWSFLSFQYHTGKWIYTVEYQNIRLNSREPSISGDPAILALLPNDFKSQLPKVDRKTESYYAQIENRINNNISVLFRHDINYVDTKDRSGNEFEAEGKGLKYSQFQKETLIGLRWTPKHNLMMNFEYHYVDGTSRINARENPGFQKNSDRYWNILAASVSYRF